MSSPTLSRRSRSRTSCVPVDPDGDSAAFRVFRADVDGLAATLPLPGCTSMQAGKQLSPHQLVRRYLWALRRRGLPKERAIRFVVWVTAQVDALWASDIDFTDRAVLRRRALAVESAGNEAEMNTITADESRTALEAEADVLRREICADQLLLASIERDLTLRAAH